jgi:hypothetical protein
MRRGSSRTVVGCHSTKFPCVQRTRAVAVAQWLKRSARVKVIGRSRSMPIICSPLNCADAVLAGEGGLHAHRAPPSSLVQRIGRVSKRALKVPDDLRLSMARVCKVPLAAFCYCCLLSMARMHLNASDVFLVTGSVQHTRAARSPARGCHGDVQDTPCGRVPVHPVPIGYLARE